MKEPVDHVLRPSLPWRRSVAITECGYDASKVPTITRAEYLSRQKDLGQQRCAMVTCMTCANTVRNWSTWEEDPRKAIGREVEWEAGWRHANRGNRLKDELVAIAALIDAHREEFDANVSAIEQRRDWNEKKAALGKQKSQPKRTQNNSL